MSKPPEWPFRCPKEGKFLSNVDAVFTDELDIPIVDSGDPDMPLLVYGTCKTHGRAWLHDPLAYQPHLWRDKHQRKMELTRGIRSLEQPG